MHDPGLIRARSVGDYHLQQQTQRNRLIGGIGERPNERNQMILHGSPCNDVLASLLFLLAVETDAGVLLQASEVMRMILDTDMVTEQAASAGGGPMGGAFADEAEGIPGGGLHNNNNNNNHHNNHVPQEQQQQLHFHLGGGVTGSGGGSSSSSSDQNQFLSLFYEHYVQLLVAPFQFTILHPIVKVPQGILLLSGTLHHDSSSSSSSSPLLQRMMETYQQDAIGNHDPLLKIVPACAIRSSFAVELLSFCVRAHLYRMKFFLLRSRVLGSVLKLLKQPQSLSSGDRCLKLAALRFLRAILSVNDEFYHRHIIQHNLFAPVFEAFRANPVGDNLVSSAIVEMCDYIHTENIKSLIEYIVTKHLSSREEEDYSCYNGNNNTTQTSMPSLEDVSSPYVNTLTILRKAYEKNLKAAAMAAHNNKAASLLRASMNAANTTTTAKTANEGSRYFHGGNNNNNNSNNDNNDNNDNTNSRVCMNEKALEDQRKFRQVDQEESYFESEEIMQDNSSDGHTTVPPAVDEVAAQEESGELHRTPRMFSLASSSSPFNNNNLRSSELPYNDTQINPEGD